MEEACRPDLVDDVFDFMISLGTPSNATASNEYADVIWQTVKDILVLVEDMPLHEVCIHYQEYNIVFESSFMGNCDYNITYVAMSIYA